MNEAHPHLLTDFFMRRLSPSRIFKGPESGTSAVRKGRRSRNSDTGGEPKSSLTLNIPADKSFAIRTSLGPKDSRIPLVARVLSVLAWVVCVVSLLVIFLEMRGLIESPVSMKWSYSMIAFAVGSALVHLFAIFSQILSESRSSSGIHALLTFWVGLVAVAILDWCLAKIFG